MRLEDFRFDLPPELIAQSPAEPRDSARLLVYERDGDRITHSTVAQIGRFLALGSLLVANNSRVRKARLYARTAAGKPVELLVLEPVVGTSYRCLVGGHGPRPGEVFQVFTDASRTQAAPIRATVRAFEPHSSMGRYVLDLESEGGNDLEAALERFGHTPLPPYIKPDDTQDERYQTVFASELGSAAAPTAGLHFTRELIADLEKGGIGWGEVTLHVGLGTFLPLREQEITDNLLHSEQTRVSPELVARIGQFQQENRPIVAVGTTSTRTLESHSTPQGMLAGDLDTEMFIYPGYRFQTVQALLTNFHLPKSSLLLLVAAFLGNHACLDRPLLGEAEMLERLHRIYRTAVEERYRFFSFGDAMLIL